ncbi:MAG: YceI family protein [Acidimicrobiia bacterium]
MRRFKWLLIAVPAAAALAFGGTWAYVELIKEEAPARLALNGAGDPAPSSNDGEISAEAGVEGTWTATTGSQAGYRVNEVLLGRNAEAAGRTEDVTGELVIEGTKVTAATVTVDMTTVESNEDRRDRQFQGRIMNVATYPTSTFTVTSPIDLGELPADGEQITVPATGALTLHGTKKTVTVDLTARRNGADIEVNGFIPIVFAEWGIPNPSFGPVTTEDHGELEFLVVFAR